MRPRGPKTPVLSSAHEEYSLLLSNSSSPTLDKRDDEANHQEKEAYASNGVCSKCSNDHQRDTSKPNLFPFSHVASIRKGSEERM